MPSYRLPREDLWALVYYVRSLAERQEQAAAPVEASNVRHIVLTGVADPGVWTEATVEVGYRGRATASPAQIVPREGEEIHLELRSADVTHAFYSPSLGIGPVEIYPGYPASFRFIAPGPGEYEYFCTNMCGHCHFTMKGTILVRR
jgi:plastocyanin